MEVVFKMFDLASDIGLGTELVKSAPEVRIQTTTLQSPSKQLLTLLRVLLLPNSYLLNIV